MNEKMRRKDRETTEEKEPMKSLKTVNTAFCQQSARTAIPTVCL